MEPDRNRRHSRGGSDRDGALPAGAGQRRRLLDLNKAKGFGQKLAAFKGFRIKELVPEFPGVGEPRPPRMVGAEQGAVDAGRPDSGP